MKISRKLLKGQKKANHDLRHHMLVISSYIESGQKDDIENLKAYLKEYLDFCDKNNPVCYSLNPTIDNILRNYAAIFKNEDIKYDFSISVPENLPITPIETAKLLGNIMENAHEACAKLNSEHKYIKLKALLMNRSLYIYAENSYNGYLRVDNNNIFSSTKRNGTGIGTSVIIEIVKKYSGEIKFSHDKGIFNVVLHIPC